MDQLSPDLLILDVALPKLNGIEVIMRLRDKSPQMPIVVFSLYDAVLRVTPPAGVAAVMSKSDAAVALVSCVKRLLAPEPGSSTSSEPLRFSSSKQTSVSDKQFITLAVEFETLEKALRETNDPPTRKALLVEIRTKLYQIEEAAKAIRYELIETESS